MQRRIFVVIHNNYTKYSDIKNKVLTCDILKLGYSEE